MPEIQNPLAVIQNQKTAPSIRTEALRQFIQSYDADLVSILPTHINLDRVKQMFILNIKQTPKLLDCDIASLMKSLFTAASMGLEPNPHHGEIYLIPYGKNVQVIPGYKGLMKLVRNSGEIASICCEAVHKNDEFEYQLGSDPKVVHRPALSERGDIIAFYCVAKFKDGSTHVEWMNKEEVDRVKDGSAAAKSGSSPWHNHYEEMGKKTVFRRAAKRLPISFTKELSNALHVDDASYTGKPYKVDTETGEVLDIWADSDKEESTPEALEDKGAPASKLDEFAGATAGEVA